MECNKDEATRAKEIAEKLFAAKDIVGARKFALKAHKMYPGLKGIPQMIATLDVYVSAENKANGELDWYGILGVNPQADEETVRKHYKKLALMLHPDKNEFVGADGAFKLISEAWGLLSDKTSRGAYDQKRNARLYEDVSFACTRDSSTASQHNFASSSVKTCKSTPKAGHSSTQTCKTTPKTGHSPTQTCKTTPKTAHSPTQTCKTTPKANHSSTQTSKSTPKVGHSSAPSTKSKPDLFWFVCQKCKKQYQFLRVYLNHKLLCPNCMTPCFGVETMPPVRNCSKPQAEVQGEEGFRRKNNVSKRSADSTSSRKEKKRG